MNWQSLKWVLVANAKSNAPLAVLLEEWLTVKPFIVTP
jgi:hypothetical protein